MSAFKLLDAVWVALFVASALVQVNDPDPLGWMAVYAAAAAVSVWSFRGTVPRWPGAAVGALSLGWALTLAPGVVSSPSFPDVGLGRGMLSESVEETRELGGLLLTCFWMTVVAVRAFRRAKPATPPRD